MLNHDLLAGTPGSDREIRSRHAIFAICAVMCVMTNSVTAQAPPLGDATVKIAGGVVGAGIGYKWGRGTLSYQGQSFEFCVRGVSIGDVGAAALRADGIVFHMRSPADFVGTYRVVSLGAAVVIGESAALLKNKRGVTMELEVQEVGVRFNIAATGVKVVMADGRHGCKASSSASGQTS
jgi:hypothetical protein